MNHGTLRRMLFLTISATALLVGTAKADTITFNDVAGTVTGTTTFAGDFPCGPTTGVCQVLQTGLFSSTATSSWINTPIAPLIYIGDAAGDVSAKLVTVINPAPTTPSGFAISIDYYFTGGLFALIPLLTLVLVPVHAQFGTADAWFVIPTFGCSAVAWVASAFNLREVAKSLPGHDTSHS